ncbi:hypothetical protein [Paracoccus aeridis]|uniref:hypothetical protein n=1 Tax=Paracoccus aeridis TaxID=1966466 RepID=UPI0013759881|nr:hypothetical protein [Paracoccus aeridis]
MFDLLGGEGKASGIYRLYRKEGLTVGKRGACPARRSTNGPRCMSASSGRLRS